MRWSGGIVGCFVPVSCKVSSVVGHPHGETIRFEFMTFGLYRMFTLWTTTLKVLVLQIGSIVYTEPTCTRPFVRSTVGQTTMSGELPSACACVQFPLASDRVNEGFVLLTRSTAGAGRIVTEL